VVDLTLLTENEITMNKEKILGIVRHILTFGGGYAVAKGYLD